MINKQIKENLSITNIFDLLVEWGGEPRYCSTGLIARTICHNHLTNEASLKLYYYENTHLFRCYTGCEKPVFDVFELCIKVMLLQHKIKFSLQDAIQWIAKRFGLITDNDNSINQLQTLEDWTILEDYTNLAELHVTTQHHLLPAYDTTILSKFNYRVEIIPWLKEGISKESMQHAQIGFYPGECQITIPHFDQYGRFIGLRGRTVIQQEAELYGKYRPIRVNGQIYNHPLGLNLYNLNNNKANIAQTRRAIVFEGEKSVLKAQTYFGFENDIYVACCGSNISAYQMQLLLDIGIQEVIIAFDRQFKYVGDDEYFHLTNALKKFQSRFNSFTCVSYILDKHKLTNYKSSPIDHGPDIFNKLLKERII